MFGGRTVWFVTGAAFGVLVTQLVTRPRSREMAKKVLRGGMSLSDFLLGQVELLREDVSDLVAEARAEQQAHRREQAENSIIA